MKKSTYKEEGEGEQNEEREGPEEDQVDLVKKKDLEFALVVKKGNRAVMNKIQVPADSYIGIKTRQRHRQEEEERKKVKEVTL